MIRILGFLAGLVVATASLSAQTNGYWDGRFWMAEFPRLNGIAAGLENRLMLFGTDLRRSGSRNQTTVAAWDGRTWSPATTNLTSTPSAVVSSGNYVWMAHVPSTNKVTRVDSSRRSEVLTPVNGRITAMAADEDAVIIGGTFTAGTGSSATNVARWNGSDWVPLGRGVPYPVVKLLATNGMVFAGVSQDTNRDAAIWRWDGNVWNELGPIRRGGKVTVRDIIWHSGKLIAATTYDMAGATDDDGAVMSWSGSGWTNHTTPSLRGQAYALAVFRDELYTGGSLQVSDPEARPIGVGRFAGNRWITMELDPGVALGDGASLAVADNQLFALARFPTGDGIIFDRTKNGLWQYDGAEWRLHSNGLTPIGGFGNMAHAPDGVVLALPTLSGWGSGGLFWNGRYFKALVATNPSGDFAIQARGKAVATPSAIYRGAMRTPASPEGGFLLARLTGTNWIPAGEATSINLISATAITSAGDDVIVAGADTAAANAVTVARWSQGRWQRLGGTFAGGQLIALESYEGGVLAGGSFKSIGGQPITNLAYWNGIQWQPLSPAPIGAVRAFAQYDGGVLVAGLFSNIGNTTSSNLAILRPGGWQSAPEGLPISGVTTVAVSDRGSIAVANTSEVWIHAGRNWRLTGKPMASSMSLLWHGQDLLVGGVFIEIGEIQSDMFAIWHEPELSLAISAVDGNQVRITRTGGRKSINILGRGNSLDQLRPWRTNSPLDLRDTFIDPIPVDGSHIFYSEISP
jgi:hypothetical protein